MATALASKYSLPVSMLSSFLKPIEIRSKLKIGSCRYSFEHEHIRTQNFE